VPGLGKPAEIKLALYVKALTRMAYDAVGVGELDARLIKDAGKSVFDEVRIPQICANVVLADTKKPLLKKPYIIKKLPSGLRVAVIGIVGTTTLHPTVAAQLGVEVLSPEETIRKTVDSLSGKADLFVLLAHSGYQDAKRLAGSVKGIDIILSSHPSPVNTDFERVGDVILMHCKGSSKYVGKLVLDIDAEGKISNAAGTQELLDAKMEKDPEMQKLIDETEAALREFYQSSTATAPVVQSQNNEPPTYVGMQRCIGCHFSIQQSWKKTNHAQALDNLTKRDPDGKTKPDCVSCHTTGYGMAGGFKSESETPYMRDVQCEACHGPGSRHIAAPSEKGYGANTEITCRKCHDGTNSPRFDYRTYRERILHEQPKPAGN